MTVLFFSLVSNHLFLMYGWTYVPCESVWEKYPSSENWHFSVQLVAEKYSKKIIYFILHFFILWGPNFHFHVIEKEVQFYLLSMMAGKVYWIMKNTFAQSILFTDIVTPINNTNVMWKSWFLYFGLSG